MQKITLDSPSGRTHIQVGSGLTRNLHLLEPRPVLMVDSNVLSQHDGLFGGFQCVTIQPGEVHKTLSSVESIYRQLLKLEVDRTGLLVGVGGGLATDVAGFAAATYLRGLKFGFISTTLLGQVDASIGGKNGVNLDGYKNMVGTIVQPDFVWCDLGMLATLDRKEYIAGMAEVIKYGAIMDEGFLSYLGNHMDQLLKMDKQVLEEVVSRSVRCKVDIVRQDERESGTRRLLNFGHTIGHAIERDRKLLHGQAVAIGMAMAARLSVHLGLLKPLHADRLLELISATGLPVHMSLDAEVIYDNILKDKKRSGREIHFVLLEEPGRAAVRQIPLKELKAMLYDLC